MSNFFRKSMLMGIGLAVMTREKIEKTIDELVKKGELSEQEGKDAVQELVEKSKEYAGELTHKVEKTVHEIIQKLDIPHREEISDLKARVENLERQQEKKGQ